jgi:L-alanine-DL-glutamate epimerase-like enolase superfamily enzyme
VVDLSSVTINGIEIAEVHPQVRPELVVRGARGSHDHSDFLLVRLTTSAGVQGIGEVSGTLIWSGEDAITAAHVIRVALAPALLGRRLLPLADVERRMDRALAGHPFTKAGLATAAWDAYARLLEVPLAVALGGIHRDSVDVKCSLSGNGDRLETGWRAATAGGFTAFKIKIGTGLEDDVARMRQLRSLTGPETLIGADANGGYDRNQAARAAHALAELGAAFLEQPVAADDLTGMRGLRGLGLPVVADESVFSMADLRAVIAAEAADAVSIYIGKSSGPGRAVALGRTAAESGLEVVIGSNGELGVGAAAQLQVAAAVEGLSDSIPHDIIGGRYYLADVIAGGLDHDGSQVRLGPDPGLGITLTDDVAERFRAVVADVAGDPAPLRAKDRR